MKLNNFLKTILEEKALLYFAERLTNYLEGAKIYFKRDELKSYGQSQNK